MRCRKNIFYSFVRDCVTKNVLLGAVVVDPTANYTEFKEAMAENAVLLSLLDVCGDDIPYYTRTS